MDPDYMANLCRVYETFFSSYQDSPVVSVDTTDLNFVASDEAVQLIMSTLERRPTRGLALPAPQLSLFD